MLKIIIDNKIPFIQGILEPFAKVEYYPGGSINADIVKDADALIIRTRTTCNKELLKGSKVRMIATATIGYDHIDTDYCESAGISWTNAPGCNASSVMQYIASVLANLAIKYKFNFADRTLGVIGVGNVGRKIVRLGEVLGMRVVMNDPPLSKKIGPCGFISLDGLLREADIISLHVPLTSEGEDKTFHLIDSEKINRMLPGTWLINSSRGEVIDNTALPGVAKSKRIAGVTLDVWENEPVINNDLFENLEIGTPHIAGYSMDGKANGTAMVVKAISKYFQLGLNDWFPQKIPQVSNPIIEVDCEKMSEQDIVIFSILHTYNVLNDHKMLFGAPDKFEFFRENYPARREFSEYTIKLINGNIAISANLKRLGFNTLII